MYSCKFRWGCVHPFLGVEAGLIHYLKKCKGCTIWHSEVRFPEYGLLVNKRWEMDFYRSRRYLILYMALKKSSENFEKKNGKTDQYVMCHSTTM
jgi:hypothetical protein